ncbi:hypothetical protein [Glaciihabitans sp. UYNi722]|uniref:hypothetical protein n=1 Tax=Glaciihabitans sp. UYNi722 TaxID=3156344 RepID=UPI0033970C5A
MTATLRPAASVTSLSLLAQDLRRHHEHHLIVVDKMVVHVPKVGKVLVTEGSGRIRVDLVADSEEALPSLMDNLERDLRALPHGQELLVEWKKSSAVPNSLR